MKASPDLTKALQQTSSQIDFVLIDDDLPRPRWLNQVFYHGTTVVSPAVADGDISRSCGNASIRPSLLYRIQAWKDDHTREALAQLLRGNRTVSAEL